jgi:hypothetical protein
MPIIREYARKLPQVEGDLREQVFLAIGEASMCWSEIPQGVFDDQHAKEIGEKLIRVIENRTIDSLFDQAKLAMTVARLADHVQRLETEVFSTSITAYDRALEKDVTRDTLRGRVKELSAMAALGDIGKSYISE